jgi:DNA-binding protein YbaB
MFGDLMGMMGKLKETQEKVKATKKRLDLVTLRETGPGGAVEVVLTANREIKEIHLADHLLQDREHLADALVVALNQALEKAGQVHDAELAAVAREGMPNIPGLDSFLK